MLSDDMESINCVLILCLSFWWLLNYKFSGSLMLTLKHFQWFQGFDFFFLCNISGGFSLLENLQQLKNSKKLKQKIFQCNLCLSRYHLTIEINIRD